LRFRLVVDDSNWPLLTGGRYSEVVVRTGLTVFDKVIFNEASFSFKGGAMINRTDFQRDNFILSVVFFQSIVKIFFIS
jgi:hypothetical protein